MGTVKNVCFSNHVKLVEYFRWCDEGQELFCNSKIYRSILICIFDAVKIIWAHQLSWLWICTSSMQLSSFWTLADTEELLRTLFVKYRQMSVTVTAIFLPEGNAGGHGRVPLSLSFLKVDHLGKRCRHQITSACHAILDPGVLLACVCSLERPSQGINQPRSAFAGGHMQISLSV